MKDILHILRYIFPYKKYVILNIIFNILTAFFGLISILILEPMMGLLFGKKTMVYERIQEPLSPSNLKEWIGNYTDYHITKIIVDQSKMDALALICVLIVIAFFFKNLTRYGGQFFMGFIRSYMQRDLRNMLYEKIIALSLSFHHKRNKGDTITRINNDVNELQWSAMNSLELFIREPVTIIISLITLLVMSPQLTLFVFIFFPLSGGLIALVGKSLKKSSDKAQKQVGIIVSAIEETLSGLRIIKAFNAEDQVNGQFKKETNLHAKVFRRVMRKKDLASPISEFMGSLVLVTLVWYGGSLILGTDANDSSLSPEGFITYILVFSQILPPAKAIANGFALVKKGMSSLERIEEVLNAEVEITNIENPLTVNQFEDKISLQNVSFSYNDDDKMALKHINLDIPKGKTIALVGESGGGKSTLADLLARFYDISSGSIQIDGKELRECDIKALRDQMGIVSQKPILFNDTIFNNITLGVENPNRELAIQAAKIANAHEFVMEKEEGYDFVVGDGGSGLSGGQQQRISIARAIYKNPPILIMDEATSALDNKAEKLVQEALNRLMENRTSIVIAHRLSTIRHADEIIVLKQGEIVERGSHEDLIAKKSYYYKLQHQITN